MDRLASGARVLIGVLAGWQAGSQFLRMNAAVESMNLAFQRIMGSQQGAANAMKFVHEEADRLGISLIDAAQGYKLIAAAAQGTILGRVHKFRQPIELAMIPALR
jgi:hypothetical protein